MPIRFSIASGNLTDAATWGLVDATSHSNVETAATTVSTSYTNSPTFTPGAITISHLAFKLCARVGTTGTVSVALDQAGSTVAGTEVTIDVADLPATTQADFNGGWISFKLASPVTLVAATAYSMKIKSSTSNMLNVWRTGTNSDWSRCLVTTTTGAPAAGDDLIVAGERTGAGTSNSFVVTMNETASTDYGSASTSLVTPAIAICDKGTLEWGTSAATVYQLKVSGHVIVYAGGIYHMGSVATPCPRDSSMTLILDCSANVDFSLTFRNLSTAEIQGQSRSSGKNIVTCKLNTDEAANSTSLGVNTDTGWLDNDEIVIASTTRTAGQSEAGTLDGNAGSSTLTVDGFAGTGGGLLNAHGGVAPIDAEIILISRNVTICGASATLQAYIDIKDSAVVDFDWVRFKWFGSATTGKRGITVNTISGSAEFDYCGFDNFVVASSCAILVIGATSNNYAIRNCTFYAIPIAFANPATSGSSWICDNLIAIGGVGTNAVFTFLDIGGTITNITAAGCSNSNAGINVSQAAIPGTISGLMVHSHASGQGLTINSLRNGTISGLTAWRSNAAGGIIFLNCSNLIVDGIVAFGNANNSIYISTNRMLILKNVISSSDSTFSTSYGIAYSSSAQGGDIYVEDSTFGVASGIYTAHVADILGQGACFQNIILHNTILDSPTEIANQTVLYPGPTISSQKHNQTAGLHKTWKREGILTIDTSVYDGSPSLRMTPLYADEKCTSDGRWPIFSAAVANGGTLTVSCKVRESVVGDGTDYDGSRVRLIVKRNVAAGIAVDTVLATATISSEGAWETISGTTAAVTDDAVLDFMVDCDGTTGWVNVDTWVVSPVADSLGMKYWQDGQPVAYGNNSSGGGSSRPVHPLFQQVIG